MLSSSASLQVSQRLRYYRKIEIKSTADPSPFGKRLLEAFKGKSRTKIAQILQVSPSTMTDYVAGRIPPGETLLKISEITKCSLDWLLLGKGENNSYSKIEGDYIPVYFEEGVGYIIADLAAEQGEDISELVRDLATESLARRGFVTDQRYDSFNYIYFGERDERLVPAKILGEIAAGKPLHIFEHSEEVNVPEEFLPRGRETFLLRVRGESMVEEGILDGDLIVCVKADEPFQGETIVALIDGEAATVKKFYRRGTQIRLEPANKEYKPIVLRADRVQVQGIVVGIYRRK
jgi:SOS regulatory protein LexA